MAGVYGIFLKDVSKDSYMRFSSSNLVTSRLQDENGVVGRHVLNKLDKDRFFATRNGVTICFEGINLSDSIQTESDFFEQYEKEGIRFYDQLKGSFSGFVYDANRKKIHVFNDHLSTKNIFYYYDKQYGFVFSSELKPLGTLLRSQRISLSLDQDAVYMMALYGFVLEDYTYYQEIKKLPYSSVVTYNIEKGDFNIEKAFTYPSAKRNIKYSDALAGINELAEASVSEIWNKSQSYSPKHFTFISGGMDARTNLILAKDLGFDNIRSITYGQTGSKDVLYAGKIASGEKLDAFQRSLDHPAYLFDDIWNNYLIPNDGLMMFHTSAHASSTIKSLNLDSYPLAHTGQLGDTVFGSFTKENFDFKKNRGSIGYTGFVGDDHLLDKIESLPAILDKYQNLGYEVYTYEQRQINATLVGDRSLNNVIDNYSPFFDIGLINLCLSLPDKYKKHQMVYFDWLKKYHKRALSYPLDKIDMKPNNKYKIIFGMQFKKYFNGAKKYFGLNYDSMNPYQVWLKRDPKLMTQLDDIFNDEWKRTILPQEIKDDLKQIYDKNIFEFRNKFAAITALMAVRLHFGDDE